MSKKKSHLQTFSEAEEKERKIFQGTLTLSKKISVNESPIALLDPELKRWIKVVRPSRAALTYERME